MSINNILSAIGLTLDIIGVLGLFFTKIQGIGIIEEPRLLKTYHDTSPFAKEMFAAIRKTNELNAKAHRGSYKWLACIILGFVLQLFVLVIPLSSNIPEHKPDCQHTYNYNKHCNR